MKKLALLVLFCAACAASAHAVSTTPPGSWVWYVPDAGYAYYTPDSGTYTWAQPTAARAPTSPRRFGAATPSTWQWVSPVIDADHGSLATGAGFVYDIHCVLTQLTDAAADAGGSTPLYVMGFDSSASSQPDGGTAPLFGITSGGLSAIGNDVTYADEQFSHGTVQFTNGLLIAVSTTADTFTAPAAGNQIRCDAKLAARR